MATIGTADKYDVIFFDKFKHYAFPNKDPSFYEPLKIAAEEGCLHKDSLIEIALANTSNKKYTRTASQLDFSDGSDAKSAVSQRRNNNIKKGAWTDSIIVSAVSTKTAGLRIVAYDQYINDWYYLAVPYAAYKHLKNNLEITIETWSNIFEEPDWGTKAKKKRNKWLDYCVDTFEELATIDLSDDA